MELFLNSVFVISFLLSWYFIRELVSKILSCKSFFQTIIVSGVFNLSIFSFLALMCFYVNSPFKFDVYCTLIVAYIAGIYFFKIKKKYIYTNKLPLFKTNEIFFLISFLFCFLYQIIPSLPDLLPYWGNVDLANHSGMILRVSKELNDESFQGFNSIALNFSYPFGFHLYTSLLNRLFGIYFLTAIHLMVTFSYSLLCSAPLLFYPNIKKSQSFPLNYFLWPIIYIVVTFFSTNVSAFIDRGWAAHLYSSSFLTLCVWIVSLIYSKEFVSNRISWFFDIMISFFVANNYLLMFPVIVLFIVYKRFDIQRQIIAVINVLLCSLISFSFLTPLPIIANQIKNWLAQTGVTDLALKVSKNSPSFFSNTDIYHFIICFVGLAIFRKKDIKIFMGAYGLVFMLIHQISGSSSYLALKIYSSSLPLQSLALVLCSKEFIQWMLKICYEKFTNTTFKFIFILLFLSSFGALFKNEFMHNFQIEFWSRKKFLVEKSQLKVLEFINENKLRPVLFIGTLGPQEFFSRQFIDQFSEFHSCSYHIKGVHQFENYLNEVGPTKIIHRKPYIFVNHGFTLDSRYDEGFSFEEIYEFQGVRLYSIR